MLRVIDVLVVKGKEDRAVEMGATGGAGLRGVHKAYAVEGDPRSSVFSMRLAWRAHYDFGNLIAEITDKSVKFKLEGYGDIPMVHAMMTAGWGLGAARAAGSVNAVLEIGARPWKGEPTFVYEIRV